MERLISQATVTGERATYKVMIGENILSFACDADAYKKADKVALCISEKVFTLHRERIEKAFDPAKHLYIILEDGEKTKSLTHLEPLLNKLLKGGLSRRSCIIAIGGGVVGDFAGFAAAIFMRGIPVIQIPTTLLAMVDSSIGGKTAVNIGAGKNIAGAFHPPSLVIQDVSFIQTLDEKEFRNGLAECVKHAFLGEPELLALIESSTLAELSSGEKLATLVARSSSFKVGVVSRDEKEKGERAILNLGHTVGHAIEGALSYEISHGEAVAIGMVIVADICEKMGKVTSDEKKRIASLVSKHSLITRTELPPVDDIIREMAFDKKNEAGVIRFVLLESIFHPIYNVGVDMIIVRDAILRFNGR
ncbi:MAG TPA: 3-dehydroquinate synthase [Spirochaetota bacterium]